MTKIDGYVKMFPYAHGDEYTRNAEKLMTAYDEPDKIKTYINMQARIYPHNFDTIVSLIKDGKQLSLSQYQALKGALFSLFRQIDKNGKMRLGQPLDLYTIDWYELIKKSKWSSVKIAMTFRYYVLPFICIVGYRENFGLDIVGLIADVTGNHRITVESMLLGFHGRLLSKAHMAYKRHTTPLDSNHKPETELTYFVYNTLCKSDSWKGKRREDVIAVVREMSEVLPSFTFIQRQAVAYSVEYLQNPSEDARISSTITRELGK